MCCVVAEVQQPLFGRTCFISAKDTLRLSLSSFHIMVVTINHSCRFGVIIMSDPAGQSLVPAYDQERAPAPMTGYGTQTVTAPEVYPDQYSQGYQANPQTSSGPGIVDQQISTTV